MTGEVKDSSGMLHLYKKLCGIRDMEYLLLLVSGFKMFSQVACPFTVGGCEDCQIRLNLCLKQNIISLSAIDFFLEGRGHISCI